MKLLPLNRQHNRDLFDCGEENLNTFSDAMRLNV